MKVRRRLLNLLTALSLLLCVAVTVLWSTSYSGSCYVSRAKLVSSTPQAITTRVQQVAWTRGTVRLSDSDVTYYPHGAPVPQAPADPPASWGWGRLGHGHVGSGDLPRLSPWNRLGFYAGDGPGLSTSFSDETTRVVALPAWLPVLVFAVPALLRLPRALSGRRGRAGNLCLRCGYDLRATPDRCPECGAMVSGEYGDAENTGT